MRVLVTGASGNLGSAVLPRLVKDGYDVRPMSRRSRPGWVTADLETGDGLTEALRDVDAVVHLASSPTKTRNTDVEGTRRLVAAAQTAGVRHLIYISIIGIDRVPLPYYKLKLETENVIRAGAVPFTIVRAAQFPSLIDGFLTASSKLGPLLIDRDLRFQPVAIEDVADRIAELVASPPPLSTAASTASPSDSGVSAATSEASPSCSAVSPSGSGVSPSGSAAAAAAAASAAAAVAAAAAASAATSAGSVVEVAGPAAERLEDLARDWLRARGSKRPIWPIRVPGRFGRELRAGALTTQARPTGSRSWADYLAAKY